jgi:hypothetical protein
LPNIFEVRKVRVRIAGRELAAPTTWTTTNASTSATLTWDAWSNTAATCTFTSSTTIATTWDAWAGYRIQTPSYLSTQHIAPPFPETPEQRAARAADQEHARQRQILDQARREAAIVRADKLLVSILSDVQRAHLEAHGYFLVRSPSGQVYRIRRGWSGNVDLLDAEGKVSAHFCAHPSMYTPDGDNMAGQKLMLESKDEELFLRVANRSSAYREERVPADVLAAALALA